MYSARTVNDKFALLCLERGKKAGHAPRAHTKGFTAQPVLGVVGRVQGRGDYLHRRYICRGAAFCLARSGWTCVSHGGRRGDEVGK